MSSVFQTQVKIAIFLVLSMNKRHNTLVYLPLRVLIPLEFSPRSPWIYGRTVESSGSRRRGTVRRRKFPSRSDRVNDEVKKYNKQAEKNKDGVGWEGYEGDVERGRENATSVKRKLGPFHCSQANSSHVGNQSKLASSVVELFAMLHSGVVRRKRGTRSTFRLRRVFVRLTSILVLESS